MPYYVDIIRVIHSQDSVYIDLGFVKKENKLVYLYRLACSPKIFKILSNVLKDKIDEFEDMVTSIELPKEPQKNIDQEHLKGNIEVEEEYNSPEFINVFRVGFRHDIFFMDVGFLKESATDLGEANYTQRYVFSPHAAKIFSNTIKDNLNIYEKNHSEIII